MVYRYILAVLAGIFAAMSISTLHKRETDPVQTYPVIGKEKMFEMDRS